MDNPLTKDLKFKDEILEALVNSFYSNRWFLVGHTIHKLVDKGIDCYEVSLTINGMTVFGFFLSSYPTLIKTMESIDEYDLLNRLKMLNIIKNTTPIRIKKWKIKEKNKLTYDNNVYKASSTYREMIRNSSKSKMVSVGVKVRTK